MADASEEPCPSPLPAPRRPRRRFPKAARLTRAGEFRRVKEAGRSWPGQFLILGVLERAEEANADSRIGFVTSRRVGGAVVRNRVRRRLREMVRASRVRLRAGCWIVLVARPYAAKADFAALEAEWLRMAGRAGILERLPPPARDEKNEPAPVV